MTKRGLQRTLPVLALLLLAAGAEAAGTAAPPPDLSGTWTFNEDYTARLMESARARQPGFGPGGVRRVPGGAGRSPGDGMPPPSGEGRTVGPREFRGGPSQVLETLGDELTITQSGGEITVVDGERTRVLVTDGKKTWDESVPGESVRSRWQDGDLVVEVAPKKGPKRTETWQLSSDGQRLFVTVTPKGRGAPLIALRRVYDRATPEPSRDAGEP